MAPAMYGPSKLPEPGSTHDVFLRRPKIRAPRKFYVILSGEGGAKVKLGNDVASFILIIASYWAATASAAAQARGGAVTIRYATLSPFVALLAGILILLIPRLLNYIVAIYLILIGLIGIFGV
jgi:hypothetical protein